MVDSAPRPPLIRDRQGRFVGARVQLESVPRLSATLIARALEGTQAFHLQWRHEIYGDEVKEAATVQVEGATATIQRSTWDVTRVALELRPLPRRGGQALYLRCPCCGRAARHLFSWQRVGNRQVVRAGWPCRLCAGLRYASEGCKNPWSALLGPRGRSPWDPEVSTPS